MRTCRTWFVIYCMTMWQGVESALAELQLWVATLLRNVARQARNLHRSLRCAVIGHELDTGVVVIVNTAW